MENHLIIGLGGTGGRVLAAFRKLMYEQFDGEVKPKDMCVDYLYVDSSKQDLEMKNPAQWRIMGESISLPVDSVVEIPAANLREYVENKSRYKYLEPWLGNSEDWKSIISDPKIGEGAAGQKRRLGRLLFANGVTDFNRKVEAKVASLGHKNDKSNVVFHVVAGLAGGTGSGCIVDVVAQLSKQIADESYGNKSRILLYLLLPEEKPIKTWASTDNYQPNGYVALTELNALEVKAFEPWDLSERLNKVEKIKSELPFYSAYLIANQNQEGVLFDVDKVMPATIAEFIYQKTIGVALGEKKPGRTESDANFFNDAEKQENTSYNRLKNKTHSHRFCGFGIKRLAIPEQEIKEFFSYSFAHQAVLKMLYNNLTPESGYVAEKLVDDAYAFVNDLKNKQNWCITTDHLCLNKRILDSHNWKTFREEYDSIINKYRTDVFDEVEIQHVDKLIAIKKQTDIYFKKGFRPIKEAGQNGVERFYTDQKNHGREKIVDEIIKKTNETLFQLWITGKKSLYQLSDIAQELLEYFRNEEDNLGHLRTDADAKISLLEKDMSRFNDKWCSMGAITKMFADYMNGSAKDELATEYVKALKEQYVYKTRIVSYGFAESLISDLKSSVQVIKSDIERAITQMQNVQEYLSGAINSRCRNESEESQNKNGVVIKHYKPELVHTIVKEAISHSSSNDGRIESMMSERGIKGLLTSSQHNFREVADKLSIDKLIEMFEQLGGEETTNFFANDIDKKAYIKDYDRLIGVNIIERLEKDFSADEEGLKNLLRRLVKHAAITNRHRDIEENNGPEVKPSVLVLLPDCDKKSEFLQRIQTLLKESIGEDVKVSRGGNSNEIVVVKLETFLTPRYLQDVYILKKAYERLLNGEFGHVARFETQLEDYKGFASFDSPEECLKFNMLPSLYEATDDDKAYIDKIKQDIGDSQMSLVCNVNKTSTQMPPSPQVSMYVHKEDGQYVLKEGWRYDGPYDYKACGDLVQKGLLTSQTLVWQEGMATWQPAGEVPELKSLFVPVPPVPPMPSSMPPIPPTL